VALGFLAGVLFPMVYGSPLQPPAPPAIANVGIFYEGPDLPLAEGYLGAHYVKNLLGHFGLHGEIVKVTEYRSGQLSHYRAAFYIGSMAKTILPETFLDDVRSSKQPICWLGQHMDQLLADRKFQAHFGLRYVGFQGSRAAWRVDYKDTLFPKDNSNLTVVAPAGRGQVEVRATAVQADNVRVPYAARKGRFWYFADVPFGGAQEGNRYLVFCDLLHDILEIKHAPQTHALARMEDVSAEAEPDDLKAVTDVLSRRHVPFQIATIPLYRNPWNNVEMKLSDRPKVVEAVHYMIDRGGTPVMHGWSHQYHSATGDDYEFWDEIKNSAIVGDSEQEIDRRMNLGMAELFANRIFPVAHETPHYAASAIDYRAMQKYFTLFYERTMPTPNLGSIQYFPYPVIDEYGRYVVPENLGYLPQEKPDPKVLIENARFMRVVRDGLPSFYFHPFLDAKLLDQVLEGISQLGYKFVSLREFGGNADVLGRYVVRTESGPAVLSPRDELWRLRRFDAAAKLISEQTASGQAQGPVKLSVDVPAGGWATLECYRPPDRLAHARETVQAWWRRLTATKHAQASSSVVYEEPKEAWILWLDTAAAAEANNQQSYQCALTLSGFLPRPVKLNEFREAPRDKRTVLVVPDAAGALLSEAQQNEVLKYMSSGGSVLADGRQKWLRMVGFRVTGWRLPVAEMKESLVEGASFSWEPEELTERYAPPPGSEALAVENDTKQPIAVAGRYGSGRYVYLSVPLDTHTPNAVSHYPYLREYLAHGFNLRSEVRGGRIETYFDPGYRGGVNPDNLAAFWKQAGVRTVYVAAWQVYDRYAFNYAALLRACHRNGIAVYAWFMFPQVTPIMWQQHPEWREQAAAGGDGRPGWRYLLNFQNPECFRAAMDWAKDLLHSLPWDGINIAELNFDAEHPDYLQANRFIPMNEQVRKDFAQKAGFDPVQLFSPKSRYFHKNNPKALQTFLSYREDIVTEWHRRVLGELAPIAVDRKLELIVTIMDGLHSDYVQPALGVNSWRIAALMKDFDFTLQVEDPVEHWAEPPNRYQRFAEAYRKIVPDERRLMFDINVVSDRDIQHTTLPSTVARGTELAETAKAAAVLGRVAIYAEHTVGTQDWPLIGAALADSARLVKKSGTYQVNGAAPVFLNVPKARIYSLDGNVWPVNATNGVPIPSGNHALSPASAVSLLLGATPTTLGVLSGDLLNANEQSTGITLQYSSPGQAAVVLSRRPESIAVDGVEASLPVDGHGDEWVVLAPKGEHRLEIRTLSSAGLAINWWSRIWSSTAAVFGAAATALMLWFYFRIRLNTSGALRRPTQ
jgi:uncharacterized protein YdaL